ncbi:MAG: nuclear transport factor 2 family protein [Ilumatobacteraceae bacterium]|nr:MAG: nuclear transport factor 2 family protein [Actinomycetota bacterium]
MADRTADRIEITELLHRYSWAMADRDWEAWQAVFTPTARVDATTAGGIAGTPAESAAWLAQTFAMFDVAISHVGNVVIEFAADDAARVRTLFKMVMRVPAAAGDAAAQPTYMEACGWYQDSMCRTGDGWRIDDRFEQLVYMRPA